MSQNRFNPSLTMDTGFQPSFLRPGYENYFYSPHDPPNRVPLLASLASAQGQANNMNFNYSAESATEERQTKSAPIESQVTAFKAYRSPPKQVNAPMPHLIRAELNRSQSRLVPSNSTATEHVKKKAKFEASPATGIRTPGLTTQTFGAIIMTKPHYTSEKLEHFQTYVFNPNIVNEWVGSNQYRKFNDDFLQSGDRSFYSSSHKTINDSYELYVRNLPLKYYMEREGRNITNMKWAEPKLGNEFMVQAATWSP